MMMLPSCFISFVWHARTHAHTTVIVRQAIFVPACYAIFTLIEGRCTVFCLHQARAAPMTDSRWRRLCLQIKTSDDIESPLWQHPIQSRYCSVIEQFRSDNILGHFVTFWGNSEDLLKSLEHSVDCFPSHFRPFSTIICSLNKTRDKTDGPTLL